MAIDLTPYATVDEYRDEVGDLSTTRDGTIHEILVGVTRAFERKAGLAPGYFRSHTNTYDFDSYGGTILDLRDSRGRAYCLTAITADSLLIDVENDRTFDYYTWDLSDNWVRGLPDNADLFSEPFEQLELLPTTTAPVTTWPKGRAIIRIAGTWGWAAPPYAVRGRVIQITRELIDAQHAGAALNRIAIEDAIDRIPAARQIFSMLVAEYDRSLVAFA